jgi:hypothetical protein
LLTTVGSDIYNPVSQKGSQMSPRGLGWMIVDSLDTMMIMNLTSQLANARQWVHTLNYDQEYDVNVFETTIRMVGGLLSAYYLQEVLQLVPSDSKDKDMYLEKATDLADRLIGAFESPSGVPYTAVNLHDRKPNPPSDVEFSSTAEVASLQLEMKYLAKLTGEAMYWEKAEKVMTVIEKNAAPDGLVPIFIDPISGKFQGEQIRFGSRGDSYYGMKSLVALVVLLELDLTCSMQSTCSNSISKPTKQRPSTKTCISKQCQA